MEILFVASLLRVRTDNAKKIGMVSRTALPEALLYYRFQKKSTI
ncbi:hypothetical protein [Pedobacter jejuensis]|nr:hypothetical protein [Pedobacter jejuensis]